MKNVITKIKWNGYDVIYTWIPDDDIKKYNTITQVYGICFDINANILIIKDDQWQIPGGTPEENETLEMALTREVTEEAQVKIKNIQPLGVQKVNFLNNPNKIEGDIYFQARFIALVDKIYPIKTDPDTNKIYERKFVSVDQIDNYINWGDVGQEMFKDAWNLFKKNRFFI